MQKRINIPVWCIKTKICYIPNTSMLPKMSFSLWNIHYNIKYDNKTNIWIKYCIKLYFLIELNFSWLKKNVYLYCQNSSNFSLSTNIYERNMLPSYFQFLSQVLHFVFKLSYHRRNFAIFHKDFLLQHFYSVIQSYEKKIFLQKNSEKVYQYL